MMGTPPVPSIAGVESNVVAFVLTPEITQDRRCYDVDVGAVSTEVVNGVTVHSADVTVDLRPDVGRGPARRCSCSTS